MDDSLTAAPSGDLVYQQIGAITRHLHDALDQLGVMPSLQQAADGLPDARSRLNYVARKSGEAAEKVLNAVDLAKAEHQRIAQVAQAMTAAPACATYVAIVTAANERINGHLTDIMMAQDFHDLTGQVVQRVVALAVDLEDSLVKLLLRAAPAPDEVVALQALQALQGPVVTPEGRSDVVANQGEVDDLLASLGF